MSKKIEITPGRQLKIDRFWRWLAKNPDMIREYSDEDIPRLMEFSNRMKKVSTRIGFTLSFQFETREHVLILSVGGNRKKAPLVQAMVDSFPEIPGWRVSAFYQPANDLTPYIEGTDEEFDVEDFSFKISDLKYSVLHYDVEKRKMRVMIYCTHYRFHYDHPMFENTIHSAIQKITGEFLYRHQLVVDGYAQLDESEAGLRPVYELGEKLEELRVVKRRAYLAMKRLMRDI